MNWDLEEGPDEEASKVLGRISKACWQRMKDEASKLSDDPSVASRIVISALTMAVANEAACTAVSREHLAGVVGWISQTCAEVAVGAYANNWEGDLN